ncbi:hypothetical protein ACOSQ3_016184 [Xanthoceras sorbifolium]
MFCFWRLREFVQGKVIVKTTHGPLDIELWPKEAPKAVPRRLFRDTIFTASSRDSSARAMTQPVSAQWPVEEIETLRSKQASIRSFRHHCFTGRCRSCV